ncbi:MAG TPA: MBL fold metallo-hydrolase [Candidatus Binataceae bacterium]|nr:MBL fold metallo-hydrolase [Candidatus Binataceae bacterium]
MFLEANHAKCKSYLLICDETHQAAFIDPLRDHVDRYLALLAYYGAKLALAIDTHTHADHRTGVAELADLTGAAVVMHQRSPSPRVTRHVEEGDRLRVGNLELRVLYTPGHTPDSISLLAADRVFTGDVLLIHGTGRCDFPGGDPGQSFDSITHKLLTLPDATLMFPAHDYRGHTQSTIGDERRSNPRIAGRTREQYVDLMNHLGLPLPDSIQEVLQPNQSEIEAASLQFPPLAQLNAVRQIDGAELSAALAGPEPPLLVDVREPEEFRGELGHIPGAVCIPLRELSERVHEIESYKNRDIVAVCRVGVRSTTAAAILTGLGFERVCNLKGGMLDWNTEHRAVER